MTTDLLSMPSYMWLQKVTLSFGSQLDSLINYSIPIIHVIAIMKFNYLFNGISSSCRKIFSHVFFILLLFFETFQILQFYYAFLGPMVVRSAMFCSPAKAHQLSSLGLLGLIRRKAACSNAGVSRKLMKIISFCNAKTAAMTSHENTL